MTRDGAADSSRSGGKASGRRRQEDEQPRPCPICHRETAPADLLPAPAVSADLLALAEANTPGWHPADGLCPECVRRFAAALAELRRHAVVPGPGFILPTHLRLGASERFRGRGVTIAFLDSGFFAHPDLVEPRDRILKYMDLTSGRQRREDLARPDQSSWHGMMTSVVACGNGRLSSGLYRGLASESRLVLVKCGTARRIAHEDIRRGLEWVVRHRRRYGVRVVNVSCGGDYEAPYLEDALSQAAEGAARAGLLVCAAAGNLGHLPGHPVLPPASAPSALTVGGLDDKNRLAFSGYGLYPSSYGPTLDGLQKPEVLAPGIWVAAPILPGTPTAAQARLLFRLSQLPDSLLAATLAAQGGVDPELDAARGLEPAAVRRLVQAKIKQNSVISGDYKHVDGTSFAAPIVSSIAAQMLEANPALAPHEVKRILIRTARRIAGVEADRQGWGVVDPEKAMREALEARGRRGPGTEERRRSPRTKRG